MLKWHREGVYAVDFGHVDDEVREGSSEGRSRSEDEGETEESTVLATVGVGIELGIASSGTLGEERLRKVREMHWVAVGGKDGKVSLWDVF